MQSIFPKLPRLGRLWEDSRPGSNYPVGSPSGPGFPESRAALSTPMAQPFPIRRAAAYRQRAHELTEAAKQPRDECDRRHMLDQAATFVRAADALAPA